MEIKMNNGELALSIFLLILFVAAIVLLILRGFGVV